ncbi:MAG: sulfur carrier protein ThiS [Oceanococcaceae bacterium]
MPQIQLNGQSRTIAPATTLAALLQELGLSERRIAVEHNTQIVPRSRHADTQLNDGDRVEIVHAIGGG